MDKLGLVVCIEDEEYRKRLLQCVMNHYKGQFEFFVYTSLKEMKKKSLEEHQGMLLGDVARSEISDFINQGEKIIFLKENAEEDIDDTMPANLIFVEKYQEVYKITDEIQKLAGVREKIGFARLESKYKVFGVYSLDACNLQIPFAAALAAVLGERKKCLLIDVQPFSGLGILEENAWGMEDLMSVALTGVYTKSRLLEGICHQENWDYLQPVKNTERLVEGSRDIYRNMMNILSREFGYEIFIFNFGSIYESVFDQMNDCDRFFYLAINQEMQSWREQAFLKDLTERDQNRLMQRITRIDLKTESEHIQNWKSLVQKWRWGEIGNRLRAMIWME